MSVSSLLNKGLFLSGKIQKHGTFDGKHPNCNLVKSTEHEVSINISEKYNLKKRIVIVYNVLSFPLVHFLQCLLPHTSFCCSFILKVHLAYSFFFFTSCRASFPAIFTVWFSSLVPFHLHLPELLFLLDRYFMRFMCIHSGKPISDQENSHKNLLNFEKLRKPEEILAHELLSCFLKNMTEEWKYLHFS